ncbi:hypothetical protein Tco_1136831 [Tanacetum coccineum]
MSYEECEKIYVEAVIFINNRLVRLIDVTVEQWLDLKYGNHMTMDVNVKKEVISTWLIRSYKMQFEEYLEIKKQRDTCVCDVDMEYDPSNLVFANWIASKFHNHLDMDWYTKNALWIYWARGDDEFELFDDEPSDPNDENLMDECEVDEIFRVETNVFDFETPTYVPWVHEKPWIDNGVWKDRTPVEHYCKPFNYKSGCSEWPTCSRMNDGYCNGGNLPGAYIVGNLLRYEDLEWYEPLEDGKLKEEALMNKAIMEGLIDEDDESSKEGWRSRDDYMDANRNYEREDENEHDDGERRELFNDVTQERSVCLTKRYVMIKYSFEDDEKYVAIKEDEYNDSTSTNEEACRAYQEIFRKMEEGWMITRDE